MKTRLMKLNGHQLALASAISLGLVSLLFIPVGIAMILIDGSGFGYEGKIFLFMPVLYFCLTYVLGRPFVWVFNKCIKMVKGIGIEIEDVDATKESEEAN